jgi:hypothetical protein
MKKKPKKLVTIRVPGHWVIPDTPGKRAYYVKPYKYVRKSGKGKKHKKHISIRVYPGKRIPTPPKGYVLDKHYDISEREGRVVYTYKLEALVEYQGRYLTAFAMDKDLRGQMALEYYHSKFEPTIEMAKRDFKEKIKEFDAFGHVVRYLSVDLYRVSGEGPLRVQHWKLLKSFNSPDEV